MSSAFGASSVQPALDPPVTGSERQWWKREMIPIRRRLMTRFWLPFLIVNLASSYLANPAKWQWPGVLWFLSIMLGLSWGCGWVMWKGFEESERTKAIRWKRIRAALSSTDSELRTPD